jgi:dihydrofolate reductase
MEGGTIFYFVTGGIHEALDRARDLANGVDVRIGGGPNTIQQSLRLGLIDEMHFAISPILLGAGERLFEGIDLRALGYECAQFVASEKATHVVLRRQGQSLAQQSERRAWWRSAVNRPNDPRRVTSCKAVRGNVLGDH